jgi:DNA ligase 1
MRFHEFATYLEELESISSRLAITEVLARVFNELQPEEVTSAVYLLLGQLVPPYESLEFGLSTKLILRALARMNADTTQGLFGEVSDDPSVLGQVEAKYKQLGDIGLVVFELKREKETQSSLSLLDVYQRLMSLAKEQGSGSQERKLELLAELFTELDAVSAKFVGRIIMGRLRLGFSDMTIIDALSWAKTGGKAERDMLESAYNVRADVGVLAQEYLAIDEAKARQKLLESMTAQVGVPVVPALCQRLNSAGEIIEKYSCTSGAHRCRCAPSLATSKMYLKCFPSSLTLSNYSNVIR